MKMLREHFPQRHIRKLVPISAGFVDNWRTSSGFRLHLVTDLAAFALGGMFRISAAAWVWLVIVFVLKTAIEPLNSAIELLVDKCYQGSYNSVAKRIKDSAAAGVFATVMGSLIIWGIIFVPEFIGIIV